MWISGTFRFHSRTLASTMPASLPGSGDLIEPWLSEASRAAVSSFSAGHLGRDRRQQQRLRQPVIGAERRGQPSGSPAASSSVRLLAASRIGRSLSRYSAVADRNSAAACGSRASRPCTM